MIYYLAVIKYTPNFSQNDNIFVLGLIVPVVLFAPVAIYFFVWFMSSLYAADTQESKFDGKISLYFTSLFVWFSSFTLFGIIFVLLALLWRIFEWYCYVLSFAASLITICLLVKFRKAELPILIFLSLLMVFAFILSLIVSGGKETMMPTFILIVGAILLWIFFITNFSNEADIKILATMLLIFIFLGGISFLNYSIGLLGYGNIDYKFISLDKKALFALPDGININQDSNETYIEYAKENNDTIKLYNIKAVQTKSGEKFELDASLVRSRQKLEDSKARSE